MFFDTICFISELDLFAKYVNIYKKLDSRQLNMNISPLYIIKWMEKILYTGEKVYVILCDKNSTKNSTKVCKSAEKCDKYRLQIFLD